MSIFQNLFEKKDPPPGNPSAHQPPKGPTDEERFDEEFLATVPRYLCTPKAEVNIRARHHQTKEIIPFAAAFPDAFGEWRQVQSKWDRRTIIYQLLDQQIGMQLTLWQAMERFTDDRYATHALRIAEENASEEDFSSADFLAASARAKFVMSNYDEAEAEAKKATLIDPHHRRARIVLADTLHYRGRHDQAHELYNQLLDEKLGHLPKDETTTIALGELVGFDGDILHSPEYAASWLEQDPKAGNTEWDAIAPEFYFSPQFRARHAFFLIRKKEVLKGFTKLLVLSQEMPWFRDAVVNTHNLIGQLGLNDEKMQKEKMRLQNILQEKGWKPDDPASHRITL
jgi:tetratricopeptide (TPR) repeat protein